MKKNRYIFALIAFCLFMPSVYAFTFDMGMDVESVNVTKGSLSEITVSLKELNGVSSEIGACSLRIEYTTGVESSGDVKSLNGWALISANGIYQFDTGNSFVSDSKIFSIPVKINDSGSVKLTNIECSDGVTKEKIADKSIDFTATDASSNNNSEVENDEIVEKKLEITLTEGSIDFDPLVFEYTVEVRDVDNFDVVVNLGDNDDSYSVERNISEVEKNLVISVIGKDESVKLYKINLIEDNSIGEENIDNSKNNKYVPIFIGIICLLVLINVFRIIKNLKK